MSLSAADIAEILRLVDASDFDELSLEFEGLKLNFKRGDPGACAPRQAAAAPAAGSPVTLPPGATPGAAPSQSAPAAVPAPADPNTLAVLAPMLGTFYRASKPGAQPFVTEGSVVSEDTIVGIIEVMKLMNTVRAGVRGTVAEILVADGALAEYGETLMRVRKPG